MLFGLARPYPLRTAGAVASLLAYTLVALVPPLLAKLAVDQGIKTGDLRKLAWIVVAFVVIGLIAFGLSSLQTYLTGWVGERALADLRIRLFSHLQRLSLGYFERNRTGAIISRITNDVEALDTLITDGVTSLVQNLMLLVGTAVVLFVLDWRLALATLAVFPLMALATVWFRIRSNRAYRRVRERIGLVTATLAEDIAGMRVVQSYAREPRNQTSFRGINTRYRDANYETIVLNGLYFPAVDFLASLATAIVLGYGGYLLLHDQVSVGTLLAFFLYLANFFDPVQQLSQLYNTFLSATAALDKIIEVLDEEPEIVDAPAALALPRIDGPRRLRERPVRLREAARGAARHLARRAGRDDGRARRADGRRQVDDRQADRPLLRRARGPDHDRRPRRARRGAEVAAPPARRGAAGGLPLRRHGRREHRVRAPRGVAGGRRRGGPRGRRGRLDPRARERLRDAARRAGIPALARPAPADRLRPRRARRPAHPHSRRGDLVGRHRHRARDRGRPAAAPLAAGRRS